MWISNVLAAIVAFTTDDIEHRQEVDALYYGVQQLMAGNLPHFLLPHDSLADVLRNLQTYLQQRQPHMTLSRLDFGYYNSEATFKTFRMRNLLVVVIDAPLVFQSLAMPFHVYKVTKLPLSTHHQHEFYTTLSTDISTLAFNRDADHFLQITSANN